MAGGRLFLVGTPIGNLEDITLRALRVLRNADLIACEDTRRTRKLLSHYDIHKPTVSYHGHNEEERARFLADEVAGGKVVALVSDAGMPGVSDPGFRAVAECVSRGLPVEVVPGPSALTACLSLCGMPLPTFHFLGFLPRRDAERRSRLLMVLEEGEPLVFYESPHRIADTLRDLEELAPRREVVLVREMTKLHEEVYRGRPGEVLAALGEGRPRGEMVVVVGPARGEAEEFPLEELAEEVEILVEGGLPAREAVRAVAQEKRVSQRLVYRAWLERKGRKGGG